MEKLKFALFSIITISLLGLLGYWSVVTLQSGTDFKTVSKIERLEKANEELKKETGELKSNLAVLELEIENRQEQGVQEAGIEGKTIIPPIKPVSTTVYKNQSLINELEKMVADKTLLKLNSRGSKVGTVQKFLNIYNKTSNQVDNDYGEGTKSSVSAFQKAEKLSPDGEAGSGTFSKMIDWLKKQG